MKKTLNRLLTIVFCLVLFAVPLLFFALPKAEFSDSEKRYLERMPSFRLDSLIDGSYTEALGRYVADHFPLRDLFVGLNAYYDLVSGRQYTKDYALKDGRLYAAPAALDTAALDKNTAWLDSFAAELDAAGIDIPVRLMLVPSAGSVILGEGETPWRYTDREIIDYVYGRTQLETVEVMDVFTSADNRDELYYRTDHHWTGAGAWEAARVYAEQAGRVMPDRDDYRVESGGDFRGSAWSGSGLWLTEPDTLELWESGTAVSVTNESGETRDSVFYRERLEELDKYTVFLDGNHSLVTVTRSDSEEQTGARVLVIRDSFSNSLGCFLADCCDKVVLVDLRYYKLPLGELIRSEGITEILVEYSCNHFVEDTNLAFLSVGLPAEQSQAEPAARKPNYMAPPLALTDAFFDGTFYMGDSVLGALANYCLATGKLANTYVDSSPVFGYFGTTHRSNYRLIYKGGYWDVPDVMRDTGAPILIAALGLNDLAGNDVQTSEQYFLEFLEQMRTECPDVTLFVQSVMPVKNVDQIMNQQKVDEYNAFLKENAETEGYCYIELDRYFKDADGVLDDLFKLNGTHINENGAPIWYEQLLNIENYYHFPEKYYVEYDGETGLPVGMEAPIDEPETTVLDPTALDESAADERPHTVLDDVYSGIGRLVELPSLLSLSDKTITEYLGLIPGEDYADGRVYICSDNLQADELWLIKCANETAASEMVLKAKNRIAQKAETYREYLPEVYEVAKDGVVVRYGVYVGMFISPDAQQLASAYRTVLGIR